MPTYDYECRGCAHRFEELQSFSEPPLTKCPSCKKNKLARLFGGGGAIIFKGSGFYETDYRKDNYKQAEKAESDAGSGKAETKSDTPASTDAAKPAAAASPPPPPPPAASPTKSSGKGGKKAK